MADIRIKDLADGSGVIDDTDFVVMDSAADGTRRVTVAQLRGAVLPDGLQDAYEAGNAITVTTAEGSVSIADTADVTDLLELERTFAGAGRLITGTMGPSTTGDAVEVTVDGDGRGVLLNMDNAGVGVEVVNNSVGDGVKLSEVGVTGYGGNVELHVSTDAGASTVAARDIKIQGGAGGAGTGGAASGDGADITITAGSAGADGGAGRGAAGKVVINAGDGPTDGDIEIGLANTNLVTVNPTAITLAASGGVARLQSSQSSAGAVVLEAVDASGTVQSKVNASTKAEVHATGLDVTGRVDPSQGVILTTPSVKTATYAIALEDHVIRIDSDAVGAFDLELPSSPPAGWHFWVKDVAGALSTAAVTVVRDGSEDIEGVAADYELNVDFGAWHFFYDGADWWVI
jgi:hypothetical protein